MVESDKPEFLRILNGVAAVKRVDLTEEAYEIWWQAIKAWAIDEFREAAGYLLRQCEFMPSPYDFEQLRRLQNCSGQEAWVQALSHAAGLWRERRSCGDELVDQAALAIGGYSVIALYPEAQLNFLMQRFVESYESLFDGRETRQALPTITKRIGGAASVAKILSDNGAVASSSRTPNDREGRTRAG